MQIKLLDKELPKPETLHEYVALSIQPDNSVNTLNLGLPSRNGGSRMKTLILRMFPVPMIGWIWGRWVKVMEITCLPIGSLTNSSTLKPQRFTLRSVGTSTLNFHYFLFHFLLSTNLSALWIQRDKSSVIQGLLGCGCVINGS